MQDGRGSADSHKTGYRPDLDGLRAVAVLSVIAYHLSNKLLPGGYLGVDIFFVLSGYLITNVIWREAINKEFSIARFYERRIRRIMPALLVLLIVVSVCAIVLLLPIDMEGFAKSVFSTLAFVANIYFRRDINYFSRPAEDKPLLHIWSLGVEEQFYIIFPLIVLLCTRWRRSALLPLTSALVLFSLVVNIIANKAGGANPAFYLLPARAWEIGAGAVLALVPVRTVSPWLRQALAPLAALLLLVSLCFREISLGGFVPAALWVVLGTTLAIYLGTASGNWLTRTLSSTPLVWIGLISYSLYLWHWPIYVFSRYYLVRSFLSPVEAAIAIVLMFLLATLSWRYIERPFRNRSMPFAKVLTLVVTGCIVVASGSAAILTCKGFPSRFSPDVARINAAINDVYHCPVNESVNLGASQGCFMSLDSRDPAASTVALIGNSHANMYAPLVTAILRENSQRGLLVPLSNCLPTLDFNISTTCMSLAAKNLSAVEALPRVRVVILAMTWRFSMSMYTSAGHVPKDSESKYFVESLDRLIQQLKQHDKTVVLVGPISSPWWEAPSIVGRQLAFHHRVEEPLYQPESAFMAIQGEAIAHYESRNDVIFIRPDRIQCQQGRCDYFRDGASLFADATHIAQGALPLFRPEFEPALKRAFQQAAQPTP